MEGSTFVGIGHFGQLGVLEREGSLTIYFKGYDSWDSENRVMDSWGFSLALIFAQS